MTEDITAAFDKLTVESSRWPYMLVEDQKTLQALVDRVQASQLACNDYILFDSEGEEIGTIQGKLGLIQIGIPSIAAVHGVDVFLVDINSPDLGDKAPFFSLLSSKQLIKVVWDGRSDFTELKEGHNVTMRALLDLQIAEIKQRMIVKPATRANWVWGLSGMQRTAVEFSVFGREDAASAEEIHTKISTMHCSNQSEVWMKRPLTDILLQYAAIDIYKLAKLYGKLVSASNRGTLLEISERFGSMYPTRRSRTDKYVNNGLLPLEILAISPGVKRQCAGCKRLLTEGSFARGMEVKCKVCIRVMSFR